MKKETLARSFLIYLNLIFLFIVFLKCYKIADVNIFIVFFTLGIIASIDYFFRKFHIDYKKMILISLLITVCTSIYVFIVGLDNIANLIIEMDKNFQSNDFLSFSNMPLILIITIFFIINIYVFLINKGKVNIISVINFLVMMTIWFTGYYDTTRSLLYLFCIVVIINFTISKVKVKFKKYQVISAILIAVISMIVISNSNIDIVGKYRYDLQRNVDILMGKGKAKNNIVGLIDNDTVKLGGRVKLDNSELFRVKIDEPTYLKTGCYYSYKNGVWEKDIGNIDDVIVYKGIERIGNEEEKTDYNLAIENDTYKILEKYRYEFYQDKGGNFVYFPMDEGEDLQNISREYITGDGNIITSYHKSDNYYPNGYYLDSEGKKHGYDPTWILKYPRGFYVDNNGEPYPYDEKWYIEYPDGFLVDENLIPHPKLLLYGNDYDKSYYNNDFKLKEYKVEFSDSYATIWPHPLNLREVYSDYKNEGIGSFNDRYIDDFNTNIMSRNGVVEDVEENCEGEFVGDYFKSNNNLEYLDNAISSGFKVNYDDVYWKTNNISTKVVELANNIVGDETDDLKKVQKIRDYLKKNYQYSLDVTSLNNSEDFLEKFLFQEKKGYCTYFATATTIMCRAVGVPARYVEGIKLDEKVKEGEYIARNSDGHAWCEVLLDVNAKGGLWTIVESTPGYNNYRNDVVKDDKKEIDDNINTNEAKKDTLIKENKKIENTKAVEEDSNSKSIYIYIIIIFVIIVFFILIVIKNLYIISKVKRSKDIKVVYRYYMHRLKSYGIKKENYETGEEYLKKISDKELKICVEKLLNTYNINMFGEKNILFDAEEYVILLEEQLKKKEKFYKYIIRKFFDISWRIT